MVLQMLLGLSFVAGVIVFGLITVKKSTECLISRQYLCQTSSFILSGSLFAFTSLQDYLGYLFFLSIFGFFLGGHIYSLKMFIYEKVRARNFNRTWSFLQMSQSIPIMAGIPITRKLRLYSPTNHLLIIDVTD